MTSNDGPRILGSLRTENGTGVVRMEDRFDTTIDDVWSAFTDPARLARWLGEVEGNLRPGGEFRAHFFASGWEGTGRIEACEPSRRLLVHTQHVRAPYALVAEVTLTGDGDGTNLVVEERGMPPEQLAAYGAGNQIHIEDLGDYLAGREIRDAEARWDALERAYTALEGNAR